MNDLDARIARKAVNVERKNSVYRVHLHPRHQPGIMDTGADDTVLNYDGSPPNNGLREAHRNDNRRGGRQFRAFGSR